MSALDDLRSMLAAESYEDERLAITILEWRSVEQVLDAFESAHPGLVDKTSNCSNCGEPWTGRYWNDGSADSHAMLESGWKVVETCDRITPVWDFGGNNTWLLCPTCAKEAS